MAATYQGFMALRNAVEEFSAAGRIFTKPKVDIFGPDDWYDYHLVPEGQRVDDPQAKEKVIALADAMDARFRMYDENI